MEIWEGAEVDFGRSRHLISMKSDFIVLTRNFVALKSDFMGNEDKLQSDEPRLQGNFLRTSRKQTGN